jgi:tyrosinase
MKNTFLIAASLLSTLSHGSPLQSLHSVNHHAHRASSYRILGAKGGVYPRMELRELEKTGEMWNLFLLAMTDFQNMDQNTIDSWFQIAGIHGMPW